MESELVSRKEALIGEVITLYGEVVERFKTAVEKRGGVVEVGEMGIYLKRQPGLESGLVDLSDEWLGTYTLGDGRVVSIHLPVARTSATYVDPKRFEKLARDIRVVEEILKETYDGDFRLFEEIVTRVEEIRKIEKQLTEMDIQRRMEKFNNLPEILREWEIDNGMKVVAKKGSLYRDGNRLILHIDWKLVKNGREWNLWLDDYVTSDGRIRRKKAREEVGQVFASKLKELVEFEEELKRQILY